MTVVSSCADLGAGINASDINYTAGRYFGSPEVAAKRLPFDAGFESVGVVAATGPDISGKRSSRAAKEYVTAQVILSLRASCIPSLSVCYLVTGPCRQRRGLWQATRWCCCCDAGLKVGQPVAELAYGAFSEWAVVPARHALPVPVLAPEIVALLTSGLTASIGDAL